jgi:hypothetical protein
MCEEICEEKEHMGLWFMNATGPVIGWDPEMQASKWSVTFINHKACAPFVKDGYTDRQIHSRVYRVATGSYLNSPSRLLVAMLVMVM